MKKILLRTVFMLATVGGLAPPAHALIVFDPSNYAQNVVTAAKAVKGEIYQNTNILYQYQMMSNQLLQAMNLNPAAMKAQYDEITADIKQVAGYVTTLNTLYGDLQQGEQYITRVQNLISTSGKSPSQWLSDMNTLYKQGNATATRLFQLGNDVASHTQTLAQRRADLQTQLSLSPTQQATAQITTHYLDIVSSQMSDLLNMFSAKTQSDAQQQAISSASAENRAAAAQAFAAQQDAERAALDALPTN